MSASPIGAVPPTAALERKLRKVVRGKENDILTDAFRLGLVDLYPGLLKPGERARADAADDDRVYLVAVERLQGIARAVYMMLIPVMDRRDYVRFGIDNDKFRR